MNEYSMMWRDTVIAGVERLPSSLSKALLVLGLLLVLQRLCCLCTALYRTFLRPSVNLRRKYGEWAMVTGATDGIGKSYAFALAKRGMSIVLVSRSEQKLQKVAAELSAMYPSVEVDYLVCDFSNFGKPLQAAIKESMEKRDVGLLINNVGLGQQPTHLHELTNDEVSNLIDVNFSSTCFMVCLILPIMLKRGSGAIVNTASMVALCPGPFYNIYCGSKAGIVKLSESLHYEYKSKGVHIEVQLPGLVVTNMSRGLFVTDNTTGLFSPSPDAYADSAVAAIGHDISVIPYYTQKLQAWFLTDVMGPGFAGWFIWRKNIVIRARKEREEQRSKSE